MSTGQNLAVHQTIPHYPMHQSRRPRNKSAPELGQVQDTADSPFELLLQRLNAQGLEITSPWADSEETASSLSILAR